VLDYFELVEGVIVLCASVLPLYIAYKVFRVSRSFFLLSALLGIVFVAHGIYHVSAFFGDSLLRSEFEFGSAVLVFGLAMCYLFLRLRAENHA
jgi:hypothetical protein